MIISTIASIGFMFLAQSNELDFFYTDRMPYINGDLVSSETRTDDNTGITYDRSVFHLDTDRYLIKTHRVYLMCFADLSLVTRPHIVAVQYISKETNTYLNVEDINRFVEVYVVDEVGRIRVYESMTPQEMAELTKRFQPHCERI